LSHFQGKLEMFEYFFLKVQDFSGMIQQK
jgi:hypothetical protein